MSVTPKKQNLFKFFRSEGFNTAREKMCAIYILLSYVNELKEDVDDLLQGYEGMYIGGLKKESINAMRAFESYERMYRSFIGRDASELGNATIDVTSAIDIQLEQSKFFLQEAQKAVFRALDEQIDKRVHDPKELEKEQFAGFEIFDKQSRIESLAECKKGVKSKLPKIGKEKEENAILFGVEIGFNTAADLINQIYLDQK